MCPSVTGSHCLCAAPVSGFHFKVPGLTQAAGGSEWIFNSGLLEPQSLKPRVQGQSWAPEQALPPGSGFFCPVVATLHRARGVRGHLLVACLRRGSLKITGLASSFGRALGGALTLFMSRVLFCPYQKGNTCL